MAAYNPSTYNNYFSTTSRYGGILSPPLLSTSLPYDLQTASRTNGLLSDRLLSPLAYKPLNTRYNGLTGPSTFSDSLLYDDEFGSLSNETDRILRNRLNFLNKPTNEPPANQTGKKKAGNSKRQQQQQQRGLRQPQQNINATFIKNNSGGNSAATDDDVLTNKIDKRISKIPINKLLKPTSQLKNQVGNSRLSNNNSNNSRQQQQKQQNEYDPLNENFFENEYIPPQSQPKPANIKQKNFDTQIIHNNDKPKMNRREDHIVRNSSQESLQREYDFAENGDDYQNNNEVFQDDGNQDDQQQQQMFIHRELPKSNQNGGGFPPNSRQNQKNAQHNSADIDITTVSSMMSSQNQSPDNKMDSKRQTPFGSNTKIGSKKFNNSKQGSVNSRDTYVTVSTPRSNLKELNLNLDILNNSDEQNGGRIYEEGNGTSMSKMQYYRENTNETIYKRESISRIKPIVVRGDVAYGKDSLMPENNKIKAGKEDKRKSYGNLVKRRNNQLILNGENNRSQLVYSVNDSKKKSSKFETRQVYSRLVKEINDDEFFQKEQNEVVKQILPQIEKRGDNLVKEKKHKLQKIKKKSEYSDYVKDRNQVLIDDQRKQRELKSRAKLINDFNEKGYGSYAAKYGSEGYSKPYVKQSYFVDLKDNSSSLPSYENGGTGGGSYKSIYQANNNYNTYEDEFTV